MTRNLSKDLKALPWCVPRMGSDVLTTDGRTPQAEARFLVKNAKSEALDLKQRILSKAREEAQVIRQQAREEGLSEGYGEGLERAQQQNEERIRQNAESFKQQLETFVAEQNLFLAGFLDSMSKNLTELSLLVCRSMLGEVSEKILPMVRIREAIEVLASGGEVLVRVHPTDDSDWSSHQSLIIIPDEDLEPGEFRLEGRAGMVDGTWDARWLRVKEELERVDYD